MYFFEEEKVKKTKTMKKKVKEIVYVVFLTFYWNLLFNLPREIFANSFSFLCIAMKAITSKEVSELYQLMVDIRLPCLAELNDQGRPVITRAVFREAIEGGHSDSR